MRILTVSLLAALLLTSCSAWHELRARHEGRMEAERDIAAGDLRLRTYGLPMSWDETLAKLLAERIGVEIDLVAGCLVTPELLAETTAYNETVEAEIARRFGAGTLKSIEKEAIRIDEARHLPRPSGQ